MAHKMLLYIDHDIVTAIADPKLIPVEAVVDFFIDISNSVIYKVGTLICFMFVVNNYFLKFTKSK